MALTSIGNEKNSIGLSCFEKTYLNISNLFKLIWKKAERKWFELIQFFIFV